jgi:hypothetical protein
MESIKDLNYYKNNAEQDYIKTPISVLRYITELEQALQLKQTVVSDCTHENTSFKHIRCNVCDFCGDVVEIDI